MCMCLCRPVCACDLYSPVLGSGHDVVHAATGKFTASVFLKHPFKLSHVENRAEHPLTT